MNRQPVSSSNIREVGYDVLNRVLEISFHSGGVYQYHGVPKHHYTGLMSASSKGRYFAQHIKNAFAFTRLV